MRSEQSIVGEQLQVLRLALIALVFVSEWSGAGANSGTCKTNSGSTTTQRTPATTRADGVGIERANQCD